jgi:hypothetical protein
MVDGDPAGRHRPPDYLAEAALMAGAVRNQGNWFARVDAPRRPAVHNKSLPYLWDYWWSPPNEYRDEGYQPGNPHFIRLVEGLRSEGFAILRKRKDCGPNVWEANGYVAVFEVSDVKTDESGASAIWIEL